MCLRCTGRAESPRSQLEVHIIGSFDAVKAFHLHLSWEMVLQDILHIGSQVLNLQV